MNVKEKINYNGIRQWEIAERLNISEFTLSRWLRRPEKLTKDKIDNIDKAINEIITLKRKEYNNEGQSILDLGDRLCKTI